VFNYIKSKNPEKNMSWSASESAEATSILGASVCTEETMSLQ
jgi:hypothetical protein